MFTDHRQLMDAVTYNSPSQEPFLKTQTESRPPQRRIHSETAKKKVACLFCFDGRQDDRKMGQRSPWEAGPPRPPLRRRGGNASHSSSQIYICSAFIYAARSNSRPFQPVSSPNPISISFPKPLLYNMFFFFRCAFMRRFVWEASAMRIIIVLNTVRSFHKFSHTSIHLNTCSRTHAIESPALIST